VDSAWTLEDLATDLAESVTGPIHLVGLSMGGYIGLAFARLFPERLSSLVLVDSRAAADSPEGAAGRIALADRIRKEGVGFLPDLLIPRLVAPGATEEVRSAIRQQILETPPETAAADAVAMANRLDARPYLGSLGVPFLAVHGTEDAIVPLAEAREMAALAKGRLEHVAGAGHMVPMEDPVACTRILAEWLREVEGR
jgi:pimeloyl-ACP methyl ester carboxylesterase